MRPPGPKLRRALIGSGGAAAAAVAIAIATAQSATADFAIAPCNGSVVNGSGSSFQNAAIAGFRNAFNAASPNGCGTNAGLRIVYTATSSGAGRGALGSHESGNADGRRDLSVRFGGSDQAPTAIQRQQIEKGQEDANHVDITAADDGKLSVIPIAIGAIAIIVHLPDNCDYTTNAPPGALFENRPTMTNAKFEEVWAGAASAKTWGQVFPWVDATCAAQAVHRIVRPDGSGTTFALKQMLARINPNRVESPWNSPQQANTVWPNSTAAPNLDPIPADAGSGSSLRAKVDATQGSIGYVDLATARGGAVADNIFYWGSAADKEFWIPLQRQTSGTFDDPQQTQFGYRDPNAFPAPLTNANNAAPGANCAAAKSAGALPADGFGDWSNVDFTYSDSAYGACTLTYDMVFDDASSPYCNSTEEEGKARTLKDFFERAVVSDSGQAAAVLANYDQLPLGALTRARASVASMGWKKNGNTGSTCPGAQPTATPTAQPTAQPTATPVPPPPPSNKFTISSARASSTSKKASVRLSLQLPGAGKLAITGTAKPKKGASVKLSATNVNVTKAGAQTVTISLSSKAMKALKKSKSLSVKLTIKFTPTGGTASTSTKTVTVKASKKK